MSCVRALTTPIPQRETQALQQQYSEVEREMARRVEALQEELSAAKARSADARQGEERARLEAGTATARADKLQGDVEDVRAAEGRLKVRGRAREGR